MMIRQILAAAALALICGCAGQRAVVSGAGENRYQQQGERIVAAVVKGDYQEFLQAANEPETVGDAEKFAASRENMIRQFGTPESFRHLTDLQTPLLINQLWIIDFCRKDTKGKKICQQQLLQLLFGEKDDTRQLLGMRFL